MSVSILLDSAVQGQAWCKLNCNELDTRNLVISGATGPNITFNLNNPASGNMLMIVENDSKVEVQDRFVPYDCPVFGGNAATDTAGQYLHYNGYANLAVAAGNNYESDYLPFNDVEIEGVTWLTQNGDTTTEWSFWISGVQYLVTLNPQTFTDLVDELPPIMGGNSFAISYEGDGAGGAGTVPGSNTITVYLRRHFPGDAVAAPDNHGTAPPTPPHQPA